MFLLPCNLQNGKHNDSFFPCEHAVNISLHTSPPLHTIANLKPRAPHEGILAKTYLEFHLNSHQIRVLSTDIEKDERRLLISIKCFKSIRLKDDKIARLLLLALNRLFVSCTIRISYSNFQLLYISQAKYSLRKS